MPKQNPLSILRRNPTSRNMVTRGNSSRRRTNQEPQQISHTTLKKRGPRYSTQDDETSESDMTQQTSDTEADVKRNGSQNQQGGNVRDNREPSLEIPDMIETIVTTPTKGNVINNISKRCNKSSCVRPQNGNPTSQHMGINLHDNWLGTLANQ